MRPTSTPSPLASLHTGGLAALPTVTEVASLEPVTVQQYAGSDTIKITDERYPAILRTDNPYTLSLHPDDIGAFTRLRNNIGLKIYLSTWINRTILAKHDVPDFNERLIETLRGHGLKISGSREDWEIDWSKP